jgi:hypothetical protein
MLHKMTRKSPGPTALAPRLSNMRILLYGKPIGQIRAGKDLSSYTAPLHREQSRTQSRPKNGRIRCISPASTMRCVSGPSLRGPAVSRSVERFVFVIHLTEVILRVAYVLVQRLHLDRRQVAGETPIWRASVIVRPQSRRRGAVRSGQFLGNSTVPGANTQASAGGVAIASADRHRRTSLDDDFDARPGGPSGWTIAAVTVDGLSLG